MSGFVTYTPDRHGYEFWMESGAGRDLFFNLIVEKGAFYGFDYESTHKFFVGLYSFMLIYLISRFSKKSFLVVLLFLPVVYLYYTTQIRFFCAFFSMCLAFYFFYIENNKKFGIFFLGFSLINHIAIILLLPLYYLFTIKFHRVMKGIIIWSISILIIYNPILQILHRYFPEDVRLTNYATSAIGPSLLGGMFLILPSLILSLFIHYYATIKTEQNPFLIDDKKFQFLYRFSVVPLVFVGTSMTWPIIVQRFIVPAILFQALLILYVKGLNNKFQNMALAEFSCLAYIMLLFYKYLLPIFLLNNDYLLENVLLVLKSNFLVMSIL